MSETTNMSHTPPRMAGARLPDLRSRLVRQAPLVAGLLLAVTASAQQPKAAQQTSPSLPQGVQAEHNLAYVANGHERQKLDVFFRPAGPKTPLVVYVHGGGWEAGSKDGNGAAGMMWRGYTVANINYRLSQHAPFPAQLEDCKAALRWLRANAARYNFDPGRVGVWGQSAGGHLVALLGTTGEVKDFDRGANLGESSRVQAVVDFFGPTDLMLYGASGANDTLGKLIGGPIQSNRAKVARANPVTYVTKDNAPFLILHGDRDTTVPLRHSQVLEAALKQAGVEVTLRVVPGAGHSFGASGELAQAIGAFFDRHLKR